jgi:hypothetical protein
LEIKFDGTTYAISQHMWDAMCAQATERGMTIDEYLAEAFTLLRKQKLTKRLSLEQDITDHSQKG